MELVRPIMENRKFNVRLYKPGDDDQIVELLKKSFPIWDANKDALNYWKCRYLNNLSNSKIIVSDKDGIIIGVDHHLFLRIKLFDSFLVGDYSGDTATHPDYRGMGVYSEMAKFLKKEDFGYYISNNPRILSSAKVRGEIRFPHEPQILIRIKDLDDHIRMKSMTNGAILKVLFSGAKTLHLPKQVLLSKIESKRDFEIVDVPLFGTNMDLFWGNILNYYDFIIEKNSSVLNWRYCDSRNERCIIKQAVRGREVLGFAVLMVKNEKEYPEGYMMELLTYPDRVDVTDALIKSVCRSADELNINVLYSMNIKGHYYQQVLERNGFVNSYKSPTIMCNSRDEKILDSLSLLDPKKTYLNYGDIFK